MRFGIGMYSAQKPPGSTRSHPELYDDMLRQGRLAEKVGLDSFWIAEHHFAEDGYVPAIIPVCAAVLGATGDGDVLANLAGDATRTIGAVRHPGAAPRGARAGGEGEEQRQGGDSWSQCGPS